MSFALSKEQRMAQQLFRRFAEKEVKPLAQEVDENERFPSETVEKMARFGFLGIPYGKEWEGQGCDTLTYILCVEEMSRFCATTGVIVSAHTSLGCDPIAKYGTPEQKEKYLPDLLSGRKLGAFALTEPGAGTDAAGQQTKAVLDGENYVLNGSKIFITNAGQADVYIIFAMTDKSLGTKGISAFIVEKEFPGFSVGKKEKKMGIRGSSTCELIFENCLVPKENMLGKEGKGFGIAMGTLDGGRIGIGAQALGVAQGALDEPWPTSKSGSSSGSRSPLFKTRSSSLPKCKRGSRLRDIWSMTPQRQRIPEPDFPSRRRWPSFMPLRRLWKLPRNACSFTADTDICATTPWRE